MGAYLYCNKPSAIALARVEITAEDGSTSTEVREVALFRYAFKPYGGFGSWGGDEKANQRMRFSSGAAACAAAWARTSKRMPELGAFYTDEDGKLEISAPVESYLFQTKGQCEVIDDYVDGAKGLKVLRWVRLPKGCEVRLPALEKRITRSCVLQVRTATLRDNSETFQARLIDKATGETSCGWWLLRDQAALEAWALKLGVLAEPAPAEAA